MHWQIKKYKKAKIRTNHYVRKKIFKKNERAHL